MTTKSPVARDHAEAAPPEGYEEDKRKENGKEEGTSLELGKLNRNWYRRCLDVLDRDLRESPPNPTVDDVKELCQKIVSGFLEAVAGQAPDSAALQFPADRTYFIPFEDDIAETFNFAKPFYRFVGQASEAQEKRGYPNSIWSFFPWPETERGKIVIDSERSIDDEGRTNPFEEMISARAQFKSREMKGDAGTRIRGNIEFLLEKSLIVRRNREENFLNRVYEGKEDFLRESSETAILAIFDIYRLTPGNAAIEHILLNHITLIRWILRMIRERQPVETVQQQEEDYHRLFKSLLRSLFLSGVKFGEKATDSDDENLIVRLAGYLRDRVEILDPAQEVSPSRSASRSASSGLSTTENILPEKDRDSLKKMRAERRKAENRTENAVDETFDQLLADLRTFRQYLLTVGSERRIEEDLVASLGSDLSKAGDTKESFVWLIPDFEDMDAGLPKNFEVKQQSKSKVRARSNDLNRAYRAFLEGCDVACLKHEMRRDQVQAYWRTLGDANRTQKVFGSFENRDVGMYVPAISGPVKKVNKRDRYLKEKLHDPRSQIFFLRVKICDSLGEPVINGLFVISTDHDELHFKNKRPELLREDQEDLIAFGKVYFFIVRDFFRALDRAQDARDIGRLNQYLYDSRLRDLDDRMQKRVTEQTFRELGLAEKKNWSKFVYEVFNNYAYSLIQKPNEVKTETFPYDRLLMLPLESEHLEHFFTLPFYLFQAVFVERRRGEIEGEHYSFIKPFQSPVEELGDQEAKNRFRSKSFQTSSSESYLEKLYVGAERDVDRMLGDTTTPVADSSEEGGEEEAQPLPPESYVPKLTRALEREKSDGSTRACSPGEFLNDWGRDWVELAVNSFWTKIGVTQEIEGMSLWRDFLYGLTLTYRELKDRKREEQKLEAEKHWFLFRFGLLRTILRQVDEHDEKLKVIEDSYHKDLRLRFDDDQRLDVIRLASTWDSDPFSSFASFLPFLREAETADIQFVQFKLGGGGKPIPNGERLVLEFFRHITELVCNAGELEEDNEEVVTWYQPLLTRPFLEAKDSEPLEVHKVVKSKVGKRLPPYDKIETGEHALSMFLGFSNFRVGRGMQRSRIRCLTVMIRDYDDSKTGVSMSEDEVKDQLEIDLRDLGLYTSTFFRNVQKFGADTMAGEDIRVLSTDVTQIARNWYSTGMDQVTGRLRRCVDRLLEDHLDLKLGRLRPELMDEFFDSLVDVLIREERKPSGENDLITLESFPFDRALHIPLTGDSDHGLRLGYTRTEIVSHHEGRPTVGKNDVSRKKPWTYERIRREGRYWTRKKWIKSSPGKYHLDRSHRESARAADADSIHRLLEAISRIGTPGPLDDFVRSMYEADAIQTLALAGLIYHVLRVYDFEDSDNSTDRRLAGIDLGTVPGLAARLRTVIGDSYRSIEKGDGRSLPDVFSSVGMSADILFPSATEPDFVRRLRDKTCMPVWAELFELADNGRPEWIYGLRDENGQSVRSKVFFVYYSVSAPESLADVPIDTRYRGIFSFIVDDARTDRKDKESETADQQDIRTFIHNSVRALRQTLDIQGLANDNRQPGIESFVLGMLHRMKNELNHPVMVLRDLAKQARQAKRKKDTERIESAKQTITGFEELFKGLKDLSDHEQGREQGLVPLQNFSTDWLGWLFTFQLCETALAVVRNSQLDITEEAREEVQRIQSIRTRASDEKRRDQRTVYSVDLIQRQLGYLENTVRALASRACGVDVDVIFSYQVFSEESMEFVGSFLLEEALVVLVENAFQAFWSDLVSRGAELRRNERPFGFVKMVCRQKARADGKPSSASPGGILLEITNTSAAVADSILDVLNAEVPQPMTKHQHESKSGKKGGSGFGHYYARRIVRGFCGGKEERRKLDIKMAYDARASQTQVSVNLIESNHLEMQEVAGEELQTKLEAVFHETPVWNGKLARCKYGLPVSIRLKGLLEVARNILNSDRQQIEEEVFAWLNSSVCGRIAFCCDEVRSELIKVLKAKVENDGEVEGGAVWSDLISRIETNGVLGVRRSSYADLKAFLDLWRRKDSASLEEAVTSRPLLKSVLGGGRVEAGRFIKPRYRKGIQKTFDKYVSYMKPDVAKANLDYALGDLDVGEGGIPVTNRKRIQEMFLPVRQEIRLEPTQEGIHLAFSYNDGSATSSFEPGHPEIGTEEQDNFVDCFRLGSTFRSYARSFRSLDRNGDGSPGALWLDIARPAAGNQGQGASRTVHLILRSRQSAEAKKEMEVR